MIGSVAEYERQQWAMVNARLAARVVPVVAEPQRVVLVSSRDDQSAFAAAVVPATARKLAAAAELAGWGVRVLWSRVAYPAGYRESSHHKMFEVAALIDYVSVRLSSFGTRAYALWAVPGGVEGAGMLTETDGYRELNVTALLAYVKG